MPTIMIDLHPQYLNNAQGEPWAVVLPMDEYKNLLEELEMQADIEAYDRAKAQGGESMPFEEFVATLGLR